MSGAIAVEEQLHQALKVMLRELQHEQTFNDDRWAHLRSLAAAFETLAHPRDLHSRQILVQITCMFAADMLMHEHTNRAQKMLDMLTRLGKHPQGMDGRLLLMLYTYQALTATLANRPLIAASSATKAGRYRQHAPNPLAGACIWLIRGEMEHQKKRRNALMHALDLLKQLPATNEVLLMEYRVRDRLHKLHGALGLPRQQEWHYRQAEDLKSELLLRQLHPDTVSAATSERLPKPLLGILDLH